MELFLFPAPVGMAVSFKPALAGFICSVLYETYPSEEVSHLWTQPLVRRGEKTGSLNRNDAIRLGARGVPPAVFGVPPKTSPPEMDKPFGGRWIRQGPVGGTPTGATGTVALPVFNCMVPAESKRPGT